VNSEHIHSDVVKSYLLGTLPDDEASAIEERYFTDPVFFNGIRKVEIDLICAFLNEELTDEEQNSFERRYLQIPKLKRLVDQVRERREAVTQPRSRNWLVPVAAALVCISAIGFVVLRKSTVPPVAKRSPYPSLQGPSLFLEPGVTMGEGSETRKLVLPGQMQSISLIAELPGETVSRDWTAQIFRIGADGSREKVFTSTRIRSLPRIGGQQVTVKLSSTDLPPGDYIMDLQAAEGKGSDTYVFRATAPDK
jgi:hypothetical protein